MKSEKLKKAQKNFKEARKKADKFVLTKSLDTAYFEGKDAFEMEVAYTNLELATLEYKLALAHEKPRIFTKEVIESYKLEKVVLQKRLKLIKRKDLRH